MQAGQCHTILSCPGKSQAVDSGRTKPDQIRVLMMADTNPWNRLWFGITEGMFNPIQDTSHCPSVQPGFGHLDPGLPPPTAKNLFLISHLNLAQGSPTSVIYYILLKHLTRSPSELETSPCLGKTKPGSNAGVSFCLYPWLRCFGFEVNETIASFQLLCLFAGVRCFHLELN